MTTTINAKQLRASLPEVVEQVRKGARFTVVYRSRAAFEIVPVGVSSQAKAPLAEDTLYQAPAVGRSTDGLGSAGHDDVLYPK